MPDSVQGLGEVGLAARASLSLERQSRPTGACREPNNQIRCSRQLPPTARSFEHSASATSRLLASMRTRCQFADRVKVWTTTGW